jgi:hypothetical protein
MNNPETLATLVTQDTGCNTIGIYGTVHTLQCNPDRHVNNPNGIHNYNPDISYRQNNDTQITLQSR